MHFPKMVFVPCGVALHRRSRFVTSVLVIMGVLLLSVFLVGSSNTSLLVSSYLVVPIHVTSGSEPSRVTAPHHDNLSASIEDDKYNTISNEEVRYEGQEYHTTAAEVKDICIFPNIDPFDPLIMAVTKFHPPLSCMGGVPHLVYLIGDIIKVNHSRTTLVGDMKHPFKECRYKTLGKAPGSDFKVIVMNTSESFTHNITLRDSDHDLVVECSNSNKTVLSRSYFSRIRVKKSLEMILEENYKKHVALHAPKEVLSVLIIGMDGNSKQNFERHMPKTRNYLLHALNAIELHKYNKIGENTYPNLVPMLTGKAHTELERYNWTTKNFFDFVNDDFVWSDFRKAGYRTGMFVDDYYITPFHYLKKGWDKPPVDYYMRATILEREHDKLMRGLDKNCIGNVPEIALNLDYWLQMASTFKNSRTRPYFGFSFSIHLTHDYHNMASAGDDLYMTFLQELKGRNLINNTVIIFFSDHGQRFGATRATYNGMIESKTPYMFLVFPPWFHRKYPELMNVLKINQERLTTCRDVYETLRDLVNFQAKTGLGDLNKKGISLFQEIPRQRSCQDAGITIEHCVCNQMTAANISSILTILMAETLERQLRSLISSVGSLCQELNIESINNVMEVQTDHKTKDVTFYQITITTTPGGGMYEATLKYFHSTTKTEIVGDIRRVNMYKGQADCIKDTKLQPFCYCIVQKS